MSARGKVAGCCMMALAIVLWIVSLKLIANTGLSLVTLVAGFFVYYAGAMLAFYPGKRSRDE